MGLGVVALRLLVFGFVWCVVGRLRLLHFIWFGKQVFGRVSETCDAF